MAQDWDIRPRNNLCSECERSFENRETYYSALVNGDAGYQRGDFCLGCWIGKEAELNPYSSWKGTFLVPPEEVDNDLLKKETAESLLRRLIEDENDENAAVIYILTVMLERKKILVEKDVKIDEDGTVHRVYEHRQSGETFIILDPQLKLDKLEAVQIRVADMLGSREKKTGEDKAEGETLKTEANDPTDDADRIDVDTDDSDGDDSDAIDEDELDDVEFADDDITDDAVDDDDAVDEDELEDDDFQDDDDDDDDDDR